MNTVSRQRTGATALSLVLIALFVASASIGWAQGSTGLGGQIFATGDDVTVTILPSSAGFTSDFYLIGNNSSTFIGTNREVGKVVDLGVIDGGTELEFAIYVENTGTWFYMGPAERNPDFVAHADVVDTGVTTFEAAFEDSVNGDFDYNDAVLQVTVSPGCTVGELALPLTDPDSISFENGNTIRYGSPPLIPQMEAARAAFKQAVENSGGTFALTSAWRPMQYQAHLREVWDKWQQLKNNRDSGCQSLKAQVQDEVNKHGIATLETRPAGPDGPHCLGMAIDVSVKTAITHLSLETLLSDACGAGLYRRLPDKDKVHFELGPCGSPPRNFVARAETGNDSVSDHFLKVTGTPEVQDDGTVVYSYSVSNVSGHTLVTLLLGANNFESELLNPPVGWDADAGLAPGSTTSPAGWTAELPTTEEVPYVALYWTAESPDQGIPSGTVESSFSVHVPQPGEYGSAHWTAVLDDGETLFGTVQSTETPPTALLNISTRELVKTGDDVLIGGFIISGSTSKKVLLRAIGASLGSLTPPILEPLADPVLELHEPDGTIITNDNWKDTQQTEIEDAGLPPMDDHESAILATLSPGAYTAIVTGKDLTSGVALIEAYDLDGGLGSQMLNISTRGFVASAEDVLIGGIIVGGSGADLLVRAIGPELTDKGVNGALTDPVLELHDDEGDLLQLNDNWKDTQQAEIAATGIAPTDDREPAILTTLSGGAYTAIIRGKDDLTGIALVEVYQITN